MPNHSLNVHLARRAPDFGGAVAKVVFQHIEKLKREYTDKFVVVDATRPELARFRDLTGQVKTVNMNGQALVQFDAWNNIAWYDISLDFLKVVPKPEAKPVQETVRDKAPPAAANAKGAVIGKPGQDVRETNIPGSKPGVPAKPVGKPSTADVLAAARAGKTAGIAEKPAASPAGKMSTADILAAARAKAAASPAPGDSAGKKMSTAEILAAARAKAAATPAPAAAAPIAAPEAEQPAAIEPVEEVTVVPAAAAPAAKSAPAGSLPTTTGEKIAWCRTHDAK